MQVLLVEDDLNWASSVEAMLRKSGHACVVVNMGQPAVELAKTGQFTLIILDIMLPDQDGYQVMKQLKEARCATPILVQSGLLDESGKEDLKTLGAAEVLIKPYGHVTLIETMVNVLTAQHDEDTGPAAEPSAEATLAVPDEVLTLTPLPEAPAGEEEPDLDDLSDLQDLDGPEELEDVPAESRESRTKALRAAEILIEGEKPLPCMVLNLSAGGASIRMPRHMTEPPKLFRLRFQSGTEQQCRVCWKSQDKIGVKFLQEEDLVVDERPKAKRVLDTRI